MTERARGMQHAPPGAPEAVAAAPHAGRRFAMARTVFALLLREMATTYGRSPGGYIWAVVQPVAAIAMMTVFFKLFMRTPSLGINFPLFYATGYLALNMFTTLSNKMGSSIRFSRPLLAYPSVTFVDAILARFLLGFLTEVMIIYLVFAGIMIIWETRAFLDLTRIVEAAALMAVLGFGVGVLNCYLMSAFPIWEQAWGILTRPLFIVSTIFYTLEDMPQHVRDVLWFNPIVHGVGIMRMGFYPTYQPQWISVTYVLSIAFVCAVLGLMLLRRHHRDLINN